MKSTLNPIVEKLKKYLSTNVYEKYFLKKHLKVLKRTFPVLYRKRRERGSESNPFERAVWLRKAKIYLSLLPKNLPKEALKARLERFNKKFLRFLANFAAAVAVRDYMYKTSHFIKKKINKRTFVSKNNKKYRKRYLKKFRRFIKKKKALKEKEQEREKKKSSKRKRGETIYIHPMIKKRGLSPVNYTTFF